MLNVKKAEMVNLCLISWGCNFKILRVIPKSFWSIVPGGKYHTKVNSSGYNSQLQLLEVFLSDSVCVQLSTFPSFALWPSFKKFTGNDEK